MIIVKISLSNKCLCSPPPHLVRPKSEFSQLSEDSEKGEGQLTLCT